VINKNNLANKTAFVSGINGGIGQEIARQLLVQNVKVIGLTSNDKNKKKIFKALSEHKNLVGVFSCNLANIDSVDEVCKMIFDKHGVPDFIINNAAVLDLKNLENFKLDEISAAFSVNVLSPIQICKFFIEDFKARKSGSFINICSSSAYFGGGTEGHTVYASTKHALLGFSRALDEEVRSFNIRVGTISPAGVATNMVKDREDLDQNSMMSTLEVADAVIYLLRSQGKGIVYEMRMWRMHR
jgi:uncharacterized protein